MIKFFRHIRQKLIHEGKTVNYLKYAIGEIVLVVIGILIALQIDNWNEKNIENSQELTYYASIKRQLNEDKNAITANIEYNNHFLRQFQNAIKIIAEKDETMVDTLAIISLNLTEFSDFHRQGNIFETIVNSGEIKLLKNQEIVEALQKLEENYILINKLEDLHAQAIMNFVVPNIITTIKVNDLQAKDTEKLYSYQFQNQFSLFSNLMLEKNEAYEYAISRINEIVSLINDELGLNS